ncbi:MAG TPA: hypothetical protein VGQ69_02250 [Gemmatimonadales bacterium]|nr:hypothetical protein [Gemmatimonadales bacterium]
MHTALEIHVPAQLARRSRATSLAPALAAAILAACTSGITGGPTLASLELVSGNSQSGPIGSTLPQPLIIRVSDEAGLPVVGVTVHWQVTSGGGSVNPAESVTDASGQASTTWRLGGTLGVGTVTASLGGSASVLFSATATTAPPANLVAVSGNGQTGAVGTQLGQPLVVRVTDAVGNPKDGVVVTFEVLSGGGSLSADFLVTGADGLASVRWTLGSVAGTQSMVARVTGLIPLTFTASATAGAPQP